jgi:hypothetical protein
MVPDSGEMLNPKLNAQGCFTPVAVAPRCDKTRTGAVIIAKCRCGIGGGQALPAPSSYLLREFHINGRRNSAEPIPVLIFAKKSQCPSIDYTLCDNPNNNKRGSRKFTILLCHGKKRRATLMKGYPIIPLLSVGAGSPEFLHSSPYS